MKRAYSYVRFSTAEQLKGKSLERQTEAARNYCAAHNLELDTELSLHDLGVSAFRGKNADTGALGSFLKAVHAGQVPQGSFLLIETFDRLSRESAYDAQITLQGIINAGITVVTLMDGNQYNTAILRENPFRILEALLLMIRSHEESKTKAKRVADAWQRKRNDLRKGTVLTSVTPGWIKLDAHRKPKLIPERAKIVRRIFDDFLSGVGRTTIARNLNKERIPTFGPGHFWTPTYIRCLIERRAVLGDFQAHRRDPSGKRIPDGEPIKGYWPPVIDTHTFNKAQAIVVEVKGRRETPRAGLKNILAGIARCPKCGSLMFREICRSRNEKPLLYYSCNLARAGKCQLKRVQLEAVDKALMTGAAALAADVPDTTAELLREVVVLEARLKELTRQADDLAMLLADTPSRTLAARLQETETAQEGVKAEIDRLNQQIHYGGARRIRDAVSRMKAALQWHASDPSDVVGVNAALRECFEKIVVDYDHHRLQLHWRQGQTTTLPYRLVDRRRQRVGPQS
jgi:DNA invertase Pin-like site-specific DNA recombinase